MGKLTVKGIESIVKAGEPGKTGDGDGLYLQLNRAEVPSWIFRYKFRGKSREMGLGRFPVVSLAEARLLAADQKRLLLKGTDPLTVRDAQRAAEKEAQSKANAVSFRYLAIEYREAQGSGWSEKDWPLMCHYLPQPLAFSKRFRASQVTHGFFQGMEEKAP